MKKKTKKDVFDNEDVWGFILYSIHDSLDPQRPENIDRELFMVYDTEDEIKETCERYKIMFPNEPEIEYSFKEGSSLVWVKLKK